MTHIYQKTGLFEGLNFFEAVALYQKLMEEAQEVEGNPPNHGTNWVPKNPFWNGYKDALAYSNKILAEWGYRQNEIEFEKLTFKRTLHAAHNYSLYKGKECVAWLTCEVQTTAADLIELMLGHVLRIELNAMLPNGEELDAYQKQWAKENLAPNTSIQFYLVIVKDVNKIKGLSKWVATWKEAEKTMDKLEARLKSQNSGNVIMERILRIRNVGEIIYPAFRQAFFVPYEG